MSIPNSSPSRQARPGRPAEGRDRDRRLMARRRARRLIPMTTGVRRYASWHEVVDEPVRRWETPTGGVSVILSFGPACG